MKGTVSSHSVLEYFLILICSMYAAAAPLVAADDSFDGDIHMPHPRVFYDSDVGMTRGGIPWFQSDPSSRDRLVQELRKEPVDSGMTESPFSTV